MRVGVGVIDTGSHLSCLMDLLTGLVKEALLYSNTEGRDAMELLSDSLVLVYVPTQTTRSRLIMILSPKNIEKLL